MFNLTSKQNGKTLSVVWELGNHKEKLTACMATFSHDAYMEQWITALRMLLDFNVSVPIFLNVEVNKNNLGRLWSLNLHPMEDPKGSIYVTQQFIHITTGVEQLKNKSLLGKNRKHHMIMPRFFSSILIILKVFTHTFLTNRAVYHRG